MLNKLISSSNTNRGVLFLKISEKQGLFWPCIFCPYQKLLQDALRRNAVTKGQESTTLGTSVPCGGPWHYGLWVYA